MIRIAMVLHPSNYYTRKVYTIYIQRLGIDNVDILTYTHVCPNVSSYGR